MRAFLAVVFWLVLTVSASAVTPDEVLDDPALEARARAISHNLRCMVCQNQSIDDSNADLAKDLRVLVRERLKAGDTDQQVIDFLVARYGEFVLLKPSFSLRNTLLWGTPIILLVIGGVFIAIRTQKGRDSSQKLSEKEEEELSSILKDED